MKTIISLAIISIMSCKTPRYYIAEGEIQIRGKEAHIVTGPRTLLDKDTTFSGYIITKEKR